jgi:hypothetical protein
MRAKTPIRRRPIAVLSTLNHNIGDEFIRDGLLHMFRQVHDTNEHTFTIYNKHKPWTFFPPNHPAHWLYLAASKVGFRAVKAMDFASRVPGSFFDKSRYIIQSGTPVIWNSVEKSSEWGTCFWKSIVPRISRHVPVFNLGGGACYPWNGKPDILRGADREFADCMVSHSYLTTTRDPLAAKLLSEASGTSILHYCCPALLAGQYHVSVSAPRKKFIVNFMTRAGHFDYFNEIDPAMWRHSFDTAIKQLDATFDIVFLCHNDMELAVARDNWPSHQAFYPRTTTEYFSLISGAYAGLVNRLHAAVGLAGLGIPSVAVGTDTRMLMTKQIGIDTLFAPDVTAAILSHHLRSLLERRDETSAALLRTREETLNCYMSLLRSKISAAHPPL